MEIIGDTSEVETAPGTRGNIKKSSNSPKNIIAYNTHLIIINADIYRK
jgi:hypothetical protein